MERNEDVDILGGATAEIDENGKIIRFCDIPRYNPEYIKAVLLFNCLDFYNGTSMIRKPITIGISNGLEARPIAMLVQVASQYSSNIYLESEAKKVNAKSIMGMMSLGLDAGESVTVSVEGEDEEEAMKSIEAYLSNRK